MRHLTREFALGALRRGKQIEQLLGVIEVDGVKGLKYVTMTGGREFVLRVHEVEDVGTENFLDVSEFPPLDHTEYVGEGRECGRYSTAEQAMDSSFTFGARVDHWVNQGVLGDEYLDLRRSRSSPND
jgi:hypothetical protein